MGGALFTEKRLTAEEYKEFSQEVLEKLSKTGKPLYIPDTFKNKDSFGDLDILTTLPKITDEQLINIFGIAKKDIKHNSSVISFGYKGFQVDLCHFSLDHYSTAKNYYRQSDCSNMIGVMTYYGAGYRFTHRGLEFPVKLSPEDSLGSIVVSTNQESIFEFFNLDFQKWKDGFDEPEDLFKWLASSDYFDPEYFKFENLNHQNRTRNKKRGTYSMFVEYLEANKDTIRPGKLANRYSAQQWVNRGLLHFYKESGMWYDKVHTLIEQRYIFDTARKVFSGNDIKELTQLEGKELGDVIVAFKRYFLDTFCLLEDQYHEKLASMNKSAVTAMFLHFYSNFQLTNPSKNV